MKPPKLRMKSPLKKRTIRNIELQTYFYVHVSCIFEIVTLAHVHSYIFNLTLFAIAQSGQKLQNIFKIKRESQRSNKNSIFPPFLQNLFIDTLLTC